MGEQSRIHRKSLPLLASAAALFILAQVAFAFLMRQPGGDRARFALAAGAVCGLAAAAALVLLGVRTLRPGGPASSAGSGLAPEDLERERLRSRLHPAEVSTALRAVTGTLVHEIRSPLFGITSTLEAFEARHGRGTEFEAYLDTIRQETRRLVQIAGGVLEFGRPETADPVSGPVGPVIRDAAALCFELAREAGVRLEAEVAQDAPEVRMRPDQLALALRGVIENAILRSARGGTVHITATSAPGEPRGVEVTVRDPGAGFTERAVREVPTAISAGLQSGLGLCVMRHVVQDHAGRAQVTSDPGGGGRVTVWLPADESMQPAGAREVSA